LDVPAGTALRFEPGEGREVPLVPFGGGRRAYGMSAITDGALDERQDHALAEARRRGFLTEPQ
jgi:urease beta subunit